MSNEIQISSISEINELINNKIIESPYLEYKASKALQKNDECKKQISKDVSAFANAGGGTILYGIVEEKNYPIKIDEGFDPYETTKEWLDQVINSTINRKIEGIVIKQIEIDRGDGRVIYTVQVPQSNRAPHQAIDKRFYTRRNFISEPMEEYEIRDVLLRKQTPDLTLDLFFRRHEARIDAFPLSLVNSETTHSIEFNGILRNEGGGEVEVAIITFLMDARLNPSIASKELILKDNDSPINVKRFVVNWGGPHIMPLFKSAEYLLFSNNDITINFKSSWLQDENPPFIQWEIKAPGMMPKIALVRLILKDNAAILMQGIPFQITDLRQDGKSREFLKTPDLSDDPVLRD